MYIIACTCTQKYNFVTCIKFSNEASGIPGISLALWHVTRSTSNNFIFTRHSKRCM